MMMRVMECDQCKVVSEPHHQDRIYYFLKTAGWTFRVDREFPDQCPACSAAAAAAADAPTAGGRKGRDPCAS